VQHVTLDDAKKHLGDLIEAAVNGDELVITKGDRPVVKLVPAGATNAHPRFGSAKGLITMSEDFDAPLEDFGEYMK
jgi:prevent-host-death family protein